MQLKARKLRAPAKQIAAPLAAATCALLGQVAPGEVKAQELAPWDIDTSLLIYSESDSRVQDLSLNATARKELREDSFLNLTLALDTLTGASPSGATPSTVVRRSRGRPATPNTWCRPRRRRSTIRSRTRARRSVRAGNGPLLG